MTTRRASRCPRCHKPIPASGGMGPPRRYCGDRSCYDAAYDRKRKALRDKAKEVMDTKAFNLALFVEEKRLRKEMLKKVSKACGTKPNGAPRVAERLPHGGSLVILNSKERDRLVAEVNQLNEAVLQAIEVLSGARYAAQRAIGRSLSEHRDILDRIGGEYLLGVIPGPVPGSPKD